MVFLGFPGVCTNDGELASGGRGVKFRWILSPYRTKEVSKSSHECYAHGPPIVAAFA